MPLPPNRHDRPFRIKSPQGRAYFFSTHFCQYLLLLISDCWRLSLTVALCLFCSRRGSCTSPSQVDKPTGSPESSSLKLTSTAIPRSFARCTHAGRQLGSSPRCSRRHAEGRVAHLGSHESHHGRLLVRPPPGPPFCRLNCSWITDACSFCSYSSIFMAFAWQVQPRN